MRRTAHWIAATLAAIAVISPAHSLAAAAAPAPNSPTSIDALYGALQWRLVGPFRAGWGEMVEGIPSRPDTFLFGASGGGVWRTDDAGRTWNSVFDQGPAAPIGAIAIAPSDPDTIYIGSGQPEPRYDVAAGEGVFKSSDGGRTWQDLGLKETRYIGRIWVHPANRDIVLVAAIGHFFGPNEERGVFRSADGGKTWSHALRIDNDTGAVDLTADPKDPNTLFAAAWQARQYPWQSYFAPPVGKGSGIYKSVDGGKTWRRLSSKGIPTAAMGRISLAATRTAKALRLYAVISAGKESGLYRSDNGGVSFARVNDEAAFTSYYASHVAVAPNDPDTIYLVGQSMRRCTQGGKTCEIVKGAPGGDDYHFVWINPLHPDHMATATDQGVVVSVNGGKTWSSWYNQPTGQFYHVATDNRFPYWIYSGQQDSGTVAIASRSDFGAIGPREWHSVGGNERDFDIPDPEDPSIVYASGLGGRLTRFDSRTGQVANIAPYLLPNYGKRQTETEHHFVWVTPMAVSRTGPVKLYLAAEKVFASSDRGDTWSIISPDLTGKQPGTRKCDGDFALADARACGYGTIWSIETSSRHAGEIWVGTDSGLIQMTRDAGKHWNNVTPAGLAAWSKVTALDISAPGDGIAYAAIDNQRQDDFEPHVMKTHDYGATWQDATGNLPKGHFVGVVRADPVRPGLLFAGTNIGVYVSFDDGATWHSLQHNLPTAWVRDLTIHGDDLIVATQGRAIWALDDISPLREANSAIASEPAYLFTPQIAVRIHPNNNNDTPMPPEEPAGKNPPAGAIIDYWLAADVQGPIEIEIRDSSGDRVARLTGDAQPVPPAERYFAKGWIHPPAPLSRSAGMHRVTWNLHHDRPTAIEYEYAIAAVAGEDTPISPLGPLALPGDYQVVLKAGGIERRAPLKVSLDPRVNVSARDLKDSLALSLEIGKALSLARTGFLESKAIREQIISLEGNSQASAALKAHLAAFADKLKPADEPGANFESASKVLTGIESDLESADTAPTEPQRTTSAAAEADVERLAGAWKTSSGAELAALNSEIVAAGLPPVKVPPESELKIDPPAGGEDLP